MKCLIDETVRNAAADTIELLLNAHRIVHLLRDAPRVDIKKPESKKEEAKKDV